MMRRKLFLIRIPLVAAALWLGAHVALPSDAEARVAFGVHGSNTVGAGNNAIALSAGLPSVELTYLHGLNNRFDLGARASFYYVFPYYDVYYSLGDELAFLLRYKLFQRGNFSLLFKGDIGMVIDYHGPFAVGLLLLQPGLLAGGNVGIAHLYGGFDVPVALMFADDWTAALIPIAFNLGVELRLATNFSLGIRARVGPSVEVGRDHITDRNYSNTYIIANIWLTFLFRF